MKKGMFAYALYSMRVNIIGKDLE